MKLTSNNFALQAFVPSHSFAGAVTGTRLKAALTHRSSRPVFSLRALPTSGQFCGVCEGAVGTRRRSRPRSFASTWFK